MFKTLILAIIIMPLLVPAQDFVQVSGQQFQINGKPYYFLGTNFWYGMNLASKGPGGNRERLLKELDTLKAIGINNLRIIAASEGPDDQPWRMLPTLMKRPGEYDENLLDGLDFLLSEMAKREMYAVVMLNNFWPWSGGMAQYVNWFSRKPIPYPPPAKNGNWWKFMRYASKFYSNSKAKQAFRNHISFIINRKNTYTDKLYKDDPTIMAWQLANEPRGVLKAKAMNRWISATAAFIKTQDPQHLVSLGSEGNTTSFTAGNNFLKNHTYEAIDYTTIHIWIQNWLWYDPEKPEKTFPKALSKAMEYIDTHIELANKLNKPLVLEEFGIARDNNDHDIQAGLIWRNKYFMALFEKLIIEAKNQRMAGANFWAWAGSGRPKQPKAIWTMGDDFIGDPPHEHQGWYSVYDADTSTLKLLKTYVQQIAKLSPFK